MWVRKRIDIAWSDLAFGMRSCSAPVDRRRIADGVEAIWSPGGAALATLSVRSGFDLLLAAMNLPRGSEVAVSAVTIPDMVRIIRNHHLVPVPVDLDIERLTPRLDLLRRAVTPRTRAILVTHLFGGRIPLEPVLEIARPLGVPVIEDCAQAYDGPGYTGHAGAEVTMFSFGSIKTSTALGGGLLRVRDGALLERMRTLHEQYPVQGRREYFQRLLKYAAMRTVSSRPMFRMLTSGCRLVGCDYDCMINNTVRGFPGPRFFERIRRQPSAPLLALLRRRLERFDPDRLARRREQGRLLVDLLDGRVDRPGVDVSPHSHWVFPVLVDDPREAMGALARAGFDANQGGSLCVVSPPDGRGDLFAHEADRTLQRLIYLPLYPEMPSRAVRRMAAAMLEFHRVARRQTADARPIHAAQDGLSPAVVAHGESFANQ